MLLSLTAMWGSAFMLTKIAVGSLSPSLVVAGRLVVACLLLIVAALFITRRLPAGRRLWLFYLLIALFGYALPFSLISWGQSHIDSGLAGILMAVVPLVTLGFAHYTIPGERMTARRAGGFLLGFIGVVVLTGPVAIDTGTDWQRQLLPMLAVLGGAVSYAVSAILTRLRPTSDALSSAAATTLIATLLMVPFGLQSSEVARLPELNATPLLAVISLGIFSTAIAAIVYFRLVTRAGPAFVSQLSYFIPLWAVAVGVLFLDESLQVTHFYALLLILSGILIAQLQRQRGDPLKRQSSEI